MGVFDNLLNTAKNLYTNFGNTVSDAGLPSFGEAVNNWADNTVSQAQDNYAAQAAAAEAARQEEARRQEAQNIANSIAMQKLLENASPQNTLKSLSDTDIFQQLFNFENENNSVVKDLSDKANEKKKQALQNAWNPDEIIQNYTNVKNGINNMFPLTDDPYAANFIRALTQPQKAYAASYDPFGKERDYSDYPNKTPEDNWEQPLIHLFDNFANVRGNDWDLETLSYTNPAKYKEATGQATNNSRSAAERERDKLIREYTRTGQAPIFNDADSQMIWDTQVVPYFNELAKYNSSIDESNAKDVMRLKTGYNPETGQNYYDPGYNFTKKGVKKDEFGNNIGSLSGSDIAQRWLEHMNTADYSTENPIYADDRRKLNATQMGVYSIASDLLGKNIIDSEQKYQDIMKKNLYDDMENYLIPTRAAPENYNQGDRYYYHVNSTPGGEQWLVDMAEAGLQVDPDSFKSRDASGETQNRIAMYDPTVANSQLGSMADNVNRYLGDLFEYELRENGDPDHILDENGKLKRDEKGRLTKEVMDYTNEYFSRPENVLGIDNMLNLINYRQIGTDYNIIEDLVRFLRSMNPEWTPVTMGNDMADAILGAKDPNKSLAQYIAMALAQQEYLNGEKLENNPYIDLEDLNAAFKAVGDSIVLGKKQNDNGDNTIFNNPVERLNYGKGEKYTGYLLGNQEVPRSFPSYTFTDQENNPIGTAIDNKYVDNALHWLGDEYGYTMRDSDEYRDYEKALGLNPDFVNSSEKANEVLGKKYQPIYYSDPYMYNFTNAYNYE